MYQCWNPRCSLYAGAHVTLRYREVFEFDGEMRCQECGRPVRCSIDLPEWMMAVPVALALLLVLFLAVTR